ncbi:MAG: hypothetical protein ACLFTQ_03725 [Candidatus Aenigmatarchaeota archaeon]
MTRSSKAQTLTIAAVLMVPIILGLVSVVLIFGTDAGEDILGEGEEEMGESIDRTKAAIKIVELDESSKEITVKNIGGVEIPARFRVYLDGALVESGRCGSADTLSPKGSCTFSVSKYCGDELIVRGEYDTFDIVEPDC